MMVASTAPSVRKDQAPPPSDVLDKLCEQLAVAGEHLEHVLLRVCSRVAAEEPCYEKY